MDLNHPKLLFNLIAKDASRTFPSTQLEGIKNRLLAFLTQLPLSIFTKEPLRWSIS